MTSPKTSMRLITAFVLSCALFLSACAKTDTPAYDESLTPGMSDPYEDVNRKIFAFNKVVNDNVVNPALTGYRAVVPAPARTGVDNALQNLQSPVHFANEVLQGDIKGAGDVTFRAVVNTLVGFGGLFDFAGAEGYEADNEDFGQTLAVWGLKHGPYIVVPILGPSSLRDYAGYFVDYFMDPLGWYWDNIDENHLHYTEAGVQYVNLRNNLKDGLKELEDSSIDYYASVRSSYYQARKAMINDGDATGDSYDDIAFADFPDYDE